MSDNIEDNSEIEESVSDPVERLVHIIERMHEVSRTQRGEGNNILANLPLWQTFNAIAAKIGFDDYTDLHSNYSSLCESIVSDLKTMPITKKSLLAHHIDTIRKSKKLFDAANFGSGTGGIFKSLLTEEMRYRYMVISELYSTYNLNRNSYEELEDALQTAKTAVEEYIKSEKIPLRVARILQHHLNQLSSSLEHFKDFGEEIFWKSYKEMFGTFNQIHDIIKDAENKEEIDKAVDSVGQKMKKGLPFISYTADAIAISKDVISGLLEG